MRGEARAIAGAIGCVLALAATPADAQRAERPLAFAASAGLAAPAGSFGDVHGQGYHGNASLVVRLSGQRLRFRPEVGLARFPVERATPGTVDPLAVSPSEVRAPVGASVGTSSPIAARGVAPAVMTRDVVLPKRHTTLLTLLGNVEVPLVRGAYLIGGVGLARVRTSTADWGDEFTSNALTYNGGAGWRFRVTRVEAFVEARVQRLSIEEGRGPFSALAAVPLAVGLVF